MALFGSNFEPAIAPRLALHQQAAVERLLAILHRRRGALLADEPGLGKSYVGAAIAREYRARGQQVRFVVPASLVAQWREVIASFGIDADVMTHESLPRAPIVAGAWRGLLVVDEAHHFRNSATQRWRALANGLASANALLITATPLCNRPSDIESLLTLFAEDDAFRDLGIDSLETAFAGDDAGAMRLLLDDCMVRRSRDVLPADLSFGQLARRVVRYPSPERAIVDGISRLEFPVADDAQRPLLRSFLRDRLDSGVAAFAESLRRQKRFYVRASDALRAGRSLTRAQWRRLFGDADAESFQDILFPSLWITSQAGRPELLPALAREIQAVDGLLSLSAGVRDRKCEVLTALLDELSSEADFSALLFTRSIATAFALERLLRDRIRCGVVTSRLARVRGHRCPDREVTFEAFRRGVFGVLIATDLAAEGLNLQQARYVIHYDMPWNPVRFDQRNGRAHRIGQRRAKVTAFYFVSQDRGERTLPFVTRKERARRTIVRTEDDVVDPRRLGAGVFHTDGDGARIFTRDWSFVFGNARDCNRVCSGHPLDDSLRRELDARILARLLTPPRLAGAAQLKLACLLESRRLATPRMLALLANRYRAGIELTIAGIAGEYVDARKVRELEAMLECDVARRSAGEVDLSTATIIVGGAC